MVSISSFSTLINYNQESTNAMKEGGNNAQVEGGGYKCHTC